MNRIPLGSRIKKRRKELGLTQKKVAELAGISISYLNLIENNRRAVTDKVLDNVSSALEMTSAQLAGVADERLLQELEEVTKDPVLGQIDFEIGASQDLVGSFPEWSKGIVHLYNSYRDVRNSLDELSDILPGDMLPAESSHRILSLITSIRSFSEILAEEDLGELDRERFSHRIANESRQLGEITRSLLDLLDMSGTETPQSFPMNEVEDFLIDNQNYFPDIEENTEAFLKKLKSDGRTLETALVDYLNERMKITLAFSKKIEAGEGGVINRYIFEDNNRKLVMNESLPKRTILFQLAKIILEHVLKDQLQEITRSPAFTSDQSRRMAFQAMSRYAAGSLLFPYDEFLEEAEACRYDIQMLGQHFQGSFEQICHRLVTLRKNGSEGIPFAFLRSDAAGNLSKRFNLPNLRFPRYGAACPLWVIYRAFMSPGTVCTQLARMPDRQTFLFISRTVSKSTYSYGTPEQIYSVMIGCDAAHMVKTIYGDGYNLEKSSLVTEAGINCKLCPRSNCRHRSHALIHPLETE